MDLTRQVPVIPVRSVLYFFGWLIILGGLYLIYRMVKRLERRLEELKRKLDSIFQKS